MNRVNSGSCSGCENTFFLRNKCIKHQVQYQLLNMKKVIVSRRMITKHEQNVLKSGLNIITARNVKMRWIAKVMLENPKRQIFFYKTSCAITCIECKKCLFLRKKTKKHLVIKIWRMPKPIFFNEKWSEYCTCKECEDEVNRKGHLTKSQEA